MNASQSTLLRALRGLGHAALFLTVFEACSNDDASAPLPPPGPASIVISGIALGQGFYGDGDAASVLACDYLIGVNVQTTYWSLLGPGRCGGALQCGQLRVSLLDLNGPERVERLWLLAAGNGAALDVRPLLSATPPLTDGKYAVRVELVDDAGKPYVASDGNGWSEMDFDMKLPGDCTSPTEVPGNAGTSGAGPDLGNAGAGGDSGDTGHAGGESAGGGHAGGDSAGGDNAGGGGTAGSDNAGGGNAGAAGTGRAAGASGV